MAVPFWSWANPPAVNTPLSVLMAVSPEMAVTDASVTQSVIVRLELVTVSLLVFPVKMVAPVLPSKLLETPQTDAPAAPSAAVIPQISLLIFLAW